jgi:hypothetical protein
MKRRRSRSGSIEGSAEIAKLSRTELDAEIDRCLQRLELAGTSDAGKAFFKRVVSLESERESLYGVPAPIRRFKRR